MRTAIFSVLCVVIVVIGAICIGDENRHDAAEQAAGEPVIKGPRTLWGQVYYLTDGVRQIWCRSGDFTECRWLSNRARCP